MNIGELLNTFFGAGLSSVMIFYLVLVVSPLVAAIMWTLPFTMIFPIYNMHKEHKSNSFIGKYLRTQTYTMVLLLVFLYATAHFVETAAKADGIVIPLLKGTGVWLIASILYYIVAKNHSS